MSGWELPAYNLAVFPTGGQGGAWAFPSCLSVLPRPLAARVTETGSVCLTGQDPSSCRLFCFLRGAPACL
jgi:hypothetical protein